MEFHCGYQWNPLGNQQQILEEVNGINGILKETNEILRRSP